MIESGRDEGLNIYINAKKINKKEENMRQWSRVIVSVLIMTLLMVNIAISQNMVQNFGFEDGDGTLPDSWTTVISEGTADFQWVTDTFQSGTKSVCIVHSDSATSSYFQVIPVLSDYRYKLSGYIKTNDVGAGLDWYEGGAQILIEGDVKGDWWDNMTDRLSGDTEWTKVEMEFITTIGATSIELNCRLGTGLKVAGTAWFDDIVIEECEASGRYYRNGDFEEETLILDRENSNWNGGWFLEFDEFNSVENGYVTIELDTTVFHSGKQSLRCFCVADRPTGWMQLMQNGGPYPEGLVDGAFYKISGWIKTEGAVSHIRMRCGENGEIGESLAGNNDWTYRERVVEYDKTFSDVWGFLGLTIFKESTEQSGTVWYDDIKVEKVDENRIFNTSLKKPIACKLLGNYPNPFNPNTTIVFDISHPSDVNINIYNILGQQVALLTKRNCKPGLNRIEWIPSSELGSGLYLYEVRIGDYQNIKKMIFMR